MATKNIMIVGVGGQGTLLTSRILGGLAIAGGYDVKLSEVHGMAQRGGSVTSHIRIGEEAFSPLIPKGKADVMIAFEPAEAVRNLDYLKPDGVVVVSQKAVKPVTASLSAKVYEGQEMLDYLGKHVSRLVIVDGQQVMEELGSAKVLNVVLLGAAIACNEIDITVDEIKAAIREKVPERFYELNLRALEAGCRLAK